MSEQQPSYITESQEALEMLGKGYEPSIEIEAPQTVTARRGGKLIEEERAAFVKIYTSFKNELKTIDGDELKIWLYLALSINRYSGEARPGLRKIAEDTGISINTVRNYIESLQAKSLLEAHKEDGKTTTYYPSDYASVKKETVSKIDTVPPTVSKNSETVLKNKRTVLSPLRKNAQLEELEELEKKEDTRPDFQSLKPSEYRKIPQLKTFIDATGWIPGSFVLEFVYDAVSDGLTEEVIRAAFKAWTARGFKPANVQGYLGWAKDGIPATPAARKDDNAKPKGIIQQTIDQVYTAADRLIAEQIKAERGLS